MAFISSIVLGYFGRDDIIPLFGEFWASFSVGGVHSKQFASFSSLSDESGKVFFEFWVNRRTRPIRVFIKFQSFVPLLRSVVDGIRIVAPYYIIDFILNGIICFDIDVIGCTSFGKLVGTGSLPRVAGCSPKSVSHEIIKRASCGMIISPFGCSRSSWKLSPSG